MSGKWECCLWHGCAHLLILGFFSQNLAFCCVLGYVSISSAYLPMDIAKIYRKSLHHRAFHTQCIAYNKISSCATRTQYLLNRKSLTLNKIHFFFCTEKRMEINIINQTPGCHFVTSWNCFKEPQPGVYNLEVEHRLSMFKMLNIHTHKKKKNFK